MFGTLTSRYHFASSYIMMPFVPVLTDADAKRAQLVAELAAKKQAREEEDAAALKALEEQIAKEAAAAKKKSMTRRSRPFALRSGRRCCERKESRFWM